MMSLNAIFPFIHTARKGFVNEGRLQCRVDLFSARKQNGSVFIQGVMKICLDLYPCCFIEKWKERIDPGLQCPDCEDSVEFALRIAE